MKGGITASGYTIVEVMIFLAVTSLLFIMAMLVINGQQNKANFAQGIRDFQASIDDSINDIRNGNFPAPGANYICTATNSSAPTFTGGTVGVDDGGQGTHDKCVFMGKVVQFTAADSATVYTVVAKRLDSNGADPTNFVVARPIIPTSTLNLTESLKVQGGLEVSQIRVKKGASVYDVGAVGFFSPFTQNDQNNELTTVVPIRTSTLTNTPDISTIIDGSTGATTWLGDTSSLPSSSTAQNDMNPDVTIICLRQGSGGKRAAVFIGDSNSKSTTNLHIDDIDVATQNAIAGFRCPA